MAYESSGEEITLEASPSEVYHNLRHQPDLMPGNRPAPVYPPNYGDLMEVESQAFTVGVPRNPYVPPGVLAPGEYGPHATLQTLMQMHAVLVVAYPESQESVE
eukprot:3125768-Pyramimonas_sp.AAC.1